MNTSPQRPLVATYRLQLTPSFGFAEAADLVEQLRALGISHLYLSPVTEAVPGSTHGYDVVDHRRVRSEFGGEEGLRELFDAAAEHGLGVVVDHVPNHVSVERAELNPPWWVMLRDGPESAAAAWFDVDWELTGGRVIVPKLGEPLDDVVEQGGISIVHDVDDDGGGSELRYGPLRFPMAAGTEGLPIRDALEAQHYRLAWWRSPDRNVRRFFTIDDLVAVCVEREEVAAVVDTLPRLLTDHEAFAGVRVDHVDGLADPEAYLQGLRSVIGDARWLVVEKIVAPGETLPRSWPVAGTTGYEQITTSEHVLLDPAGRPALDGLWRELADAAGQDHDFDRLEHLARREVLAGGLRPDLDRLVRVAARRGSPPSEDLRAGFVELTLALDRYRTYLPDPESSDVLDEAADAAALHAPEHADAVAHVLQLVREDEVLRTRWQQLTGPVMAKGAEDRAFYRYQRLSSLCEVGGSPGTWTLAVDDFHTHQQRVQDGWATTMLTATTHDTKRSAAVRARSLALVTRADEWADLVRTWLADNDIGSLRPPDVSLALQTVATAWPLDVDRLHAYLVKATREADLATAWTEPDDRYETDLRDLASRLVEQTADDDSSLGRFAGELVSPGSAIGLRLLALQLTCPGVPDLYQGAPRELLSLVDPDNRGDVPWTEWTHLVEDAARHERALDIEDPDEAGTHLVARVLDARRRLAAAFGDGAGYRPLGVSGPDAAGVVAFARLDPDGRPAVITIVVRPSASEPDATVDLPAGPWYDLVHAVSAPDGHNVVSDVAGHLGVAVLRRG